MFFVLDVGKWRCDSDSEGFTPWSSQVELDYLQTGTAYNQ